MVASLTEPDPLNIDTATDTIAVIDSAGEHSYAELRDAVMSQADEMEGLPAGVALLRFRPSMSALVFYLAAMRSGRSVILTDRDTKPDVVTDFIDRYGITLEFASDETAVVHDHDKPMKNPTVPQVLLPTSGSTGSPKMVRLTLDAIAANARSIAFDLEIEESDVAPTTLPLQYSYGLSVLNSHLVAGATVVLTDHSVMTREFWDVFDRSGCTSFAGVPYTYSMLARMRFSPADHPSLRTMTQAGGRLSVDLRQRFHGAMDEVGGRFVVMYGQTEATARMAILPHTELPGRLDAAGRALRHGQFSVLVHGHETDTADVEGEIIYRGPNVMMGYAENHADLHMNDEFLGRLPTGDTGRLDCDGFLWLSGRQKRIAKVFGERVSLDDVERLASYLELPVAAVSGDDHVAVFIESDDEAILNEARKHLAAELGVHRTGIRVQSVPALPLLENGKIDYAGLTHRAQGEERSVGNEKER